MRPADRDRKGGRAETRSDRARRPRKAVLRETLVYLRGEGIMPSVAMSDERGTAREHRHVRVNLAGEKANRRPRRAPPSGRGIASALQTMTTTLTDHDIYLFKEGNHARLYDKLGAHLLSDGSAHFAVWAPNARAVSVIGDFNGWN